MDFMFNDRSPILTIAFAGVVAIVLHRIYTFLYPKTPHLNFPLIKLDDNWRDSGQTWQNRARDLIDKGEKTTSGPFRIWAGIEEVVVIPNHLAQEVRASESKMSFVEAVSADFPVYPGFETFKASNDGHGVLAELTRTKLTQSISALVRDLAEECDLAARDRFPETDMWSSSELKEDAIQVIARLSTRAFLGPDMSRQKAWLDLSKNCTIDSFIVASKIRLLPELVRYVAVWFMPECKKVRDQLHVAREYIQEELDRRSNADRKAVDAGQTPPKRVDAITWLNELKGQKGRVLDQTLMQMGFTVAGLHTTNEALCNAMLDCCRHPDVIPSLREEIVSVLSEHGWNSKALAKMQRLDSFLKESTRRSPLEVVSMNRIVRQPIQFSDGSILPTNTRIVVLPNYQDPKLYPEPEKFVAERFLTRRQQPGQESSSQHVSATPEHLYFGYGTHACPGRFFASAELKIALCFLLLRYDWKLAKEDPMTSSSGLRPLVPYDCTVLFRSRQPELDLSNV